MWLDILWKDLLEFNTKFCYRIFCREQFVEISKLFGFWNFLLRNILQVSILHFKNLANSTVNSLPKDLHFVFWNFPLRNILPMNILHFWDSTTKYSADENSAFLELCCEIFFQWTFCISRVLLQNNLPMNIMHFWGSSRKIFC